MLLNKITYLLILLFRELFEMYLYILTIEINERSCHTFFFPTSVGIYLCQILLKYFRNITSESFYHGVITIMSPGSSELCHGLRMKLGVEQKCEKT